MKPAAIAGTSPRVRLALGFSLLLFLCSTGCASGRVLTGIDVLQSDGFRVLAGQRVGLITNPTGVDRQLCSTVDLLHQAPGVQLVALFGPEHGVRGEAHAGDHVEDARDSLTGVPTFSLYGANRTPTAESLEGIDTLVFDIQDIGSRSYTYISTMAAAMRAAAEHGKRFVVLDRPNPLNGNRIEGRVLDPAFRSFVGYLPIPYVHGMTVGELARMINGEGWLGEAGPCDLHVVPMRGWQRSMYFEETGLPWIPTSPHIPHSETSLHYAATGIMGELKIISEGVGYTMPFEICGHPDIDPYTFSQQLNARNLPGVFFRPMYWRPYYARHVGETCGGVQVMLTDRDAAELTTIQFHVIDVVQQMHPELQLFGTKRDAMFDKVCGTDVIRKLLSGNDSIEAVLKAWREDLGAFRSERSRYLLYR